MVMVLEWGFRVLKKHYLLPGGGMPAGFDCWTCDYVWEHPARVDEYSVCRRGALRGGP